MQNHPCLFDNQQHKELISCTFDAKSRRDGQLRRGAAAAGRHSGLAQGRFRKVQEARSFRTRSGPARVRGPADRGKVRLFRSVRRTGNAASQGGGRASRTGSASASRRRTCPTAVASACFRSTSPESGPVSRSLCLIHHFIPAKLRPVFTE